MLYEMIFFSNFDFFFKLRRRLLLRRGGGGFLLRRGGGGRNDDDHFSHLRRWICSWWRASTCDEISILRRSLLLLPKHDYDNDDENEGDDDNNGDDHENGD